MGVRCQYTLYLYLFLDLFVPLHSLSKHGYTGKKGGEKFLLDDLINKEVDKDSQTFHVLRVPSSSQSAKQA